MARHPDIASPTPLYISVGEAARLAGVSPSTLRVWEQRGLISPDRSPSGYRRYTLADIEKLKRIHRTRQQNGIVNTAAEDSGLAPRKNAGGHDHRDVIPLLPWERQLREQRQQLNLSLRRVAEITGLSASFISGIERGLANPSVAALQKLTAAYGISIVDLMEADIAPRGCLMRVDDRQRDDAVAGVMVDQLNFGNHRMALHVFTVAPGAGAGGEGHHEGEEFILMLEGTLHVSIDTIEHYIMNPGDILYFESFHRHEWVNPGPAVAVFLGVNTPGTC